MPYPGWMRFGAEYGAPVSNGPLVLNNEYTRRLAVEEGCSHMLVGDRCETLIDAVGPLVNDLVIESPWYDPRYPDESSRFLGVFGIDSSLIDSSTRETPVVQGIEDGGVIGHTRHAVAQLRQRAVLIARGRDALDWGMSWLDRRLDPDGCGKHIQQCGVADLEFLADCPPPRPITTVYSEWSTTIENHATHPNLVLTSGGEVEGVSITPGGGTNTPIAPGVRVTLSVTTPVAIGLAYAGALPASGDPVTLMVRARANEVRNVDLRVGTGGSAAETVTLTPDWNDFYATVDLGTIGSGLDVGMLVTADTVGDWVEIDRYMVIPGTYEAGFEVGYFDGSSTPPTGRADTWRFQWTGAQDASTSLWQTRTVDEVPMPLVEWREQYVNPLRRFLLNAACTSGPIPISRFSRNGIHVVEVEWTFTSELAFAVDMPLNVLTPEDPLDPTLVQDVSTNLNPYPSMELAGATGVIGTNYSANPSVETNATGWSAAQTTITGTLSGARSTEVAASGVASFKASLTATNTASAGNLKAYQDVTLPAYSSGQRFSFSMWGFMTKTGTAVLSHTRFVLEWRDAGNAIIGAPIELGLGEVSGGAISASSMLRPVGAVTARCIMEGHVTSWSSGAVLNLYADALLVSLP